jgi:putative DNA primase/helicase
MIFLAAKEPGIPITPEELDSDDWVFNCANYTLNLKTGDVYPHRRSDFITKRAPISIDAKATAPIWNEVLKRCFDGNTNLISFLQRVFGYSLTGSTREQCLFFFYGLGANGKTTILETIRSMMGDYARQTDFSTFLLKQNDGGARNDLAALKGSRFVSGAEVDSGKKLAEVLVKQITGQDCITARFLHQEFFEFRPTFKLFLAANHKPIIRGTDYAIWRRIKLVPFTVTIPEDEQDPDLLTKLKAELPGIFNWTVQGCAEWQESGLKTPDEVKLAVKGYQEEMDLLGAFFKDCCCFSADAETPTKVLRKGYESWCEKNGEEAITPHKMAQRLRERGCESAQLGASRERGWKGVRLI